MSARQSDLLDRYRMTVDDYRIMNAEGILRPEDRTELIEGIIYDMLPHGSEHAEILQRLSERLRNAVGGAASVYVQSPVELGHICETKPDIVLLLPRANRNEAANPGPKEVLLIVEIADNRARDVRGVKVPLYAGYGIPEVWFVDIENRLPFVCQVPGADEYRETQVLDRPTRLAPRLLPECGVDLSGLF